MSRKTNDAGISLIKKAEGCKLTAYKCPAGILTIGFGHTSAAGEPKVTEGLKITEKEAEDILRRDLSKVESAVERLVKKPISDNQFSALVSLVFNIGQNAFANSTLLKRINEGKFSEAPKEIQRWNKVQGVPVKGLTRRRQAEADLWCKE